MPDTTPATNINPVHGNNFVIQDDILPKVNEVKRFFRVLLSRKIVILGTLIVLFAVFVAIFAPYIAPYGPYDQDLNNVLQAPSSEHLLGTDAIGRDLLSRIIYGTQIALIVGVGTVFLAATIGTIIGLIAGYMGGWTFTIIMRLTDAVMAIPPLPLALVVSMVLGSGVRGVIIAVSVSFLPGYIRLICGQVLSVRENDYVLAVRSMGGSKARIMFVHILPNCVSPLIVQVTMMMGLAILIEASLSFLGLGISPPTAAWGSMVYDGYKYLLMRPLLSIAPGIAIMILVFAFNMFGDGLRDTLDPRLRGSV